MPRHLFLMLMEQAACTRFVEAHHAAITCAMSGWKPNAPSHHGDPHGIRLERLRERADREKQRHLHWLNLRRAHAGLPALEDA
jgi:hypothetical protein